MATLSSPIAECRNKVVSESNNDFLLGLVQAIVRLVRGWVKLLQQSILPNNIIKEWPNVLLYIALTLSQISQATILHKH